jgi:ribosomal protein S18 acetylase RimI-like enzyme
MPPTLRRAVLADTPLITEFNQRLAQESEGKSLDLAVLTAGVAAALADPHKGPYFLLEDEGVVLGQLQITTEWSDWRNGWMWWIQSVYVRPEARRQGVFRALFQHVLETARADPQVVAIRLYVECENQIAQQVYASLGMERTGYLVMERCPL